MTSRQVAAAARRVADLNSARLRDAAGGGLHRATVTTVIPGGASDGNALVSVTWRGTELAVAGYPDSYTPVVGHRVLIAIADDQLEIFHRSVGSP